MSNREEVYRLTPMGAIGDPDTYKRVIEYMITMGQKLGPQAMVVVYPPDGEPVLRWASIEPNEQPTLFDQ